jgi:putative radical SAM enzyme (TIGR03279 family)
MNIVEITPNTPAYALGIKVGDQLNTINGRKISDVIDYEFYAADEELLLNISRGEESIDLEVVKGLDEELGIVVEPMSMRSCANNCVFCFAHQNPPGVRDALNFKDGDFRFSFLHGHYITMTNMGKKQLERVVEQHLSPLYISVHVTDPEIRKEMLLYGKDDQILDKLTFLTDNNIELHTQIVLCPGWNDGEILLQTIRDLIKLAPGVHSVSIVPVGLTKYRDSLPKLRSYDSASARDFIHWFNLQETAFQIEGLDRFVYLSDEFFILAGLDIPENDYYGEFSMVENGVGQCRDFVNRFNAAVPYLPEKLSKPVRLLFPTGTLVHSFLENTLSEQLDAIENLQYEIIPIKNEWLGADLVTVAGLTSARDIVTQLMPYKDVDAIYLSYRMFSEDGVTLDDHTREDIEKKLGVPIFIHHEDMLEILEPWV